MSGKTVRIGGASGYWGDTASAPRQLVEKGDIHYLVFDYLAEVTMSLLARSQARNPEGGFARDFTEWVWKDNLRALKTQGVKLVTNAGGLNPADGPEEFDHHPRFKQLIDRGAMGTEPTVRPNPCL